MALNTDFYSYFFVLILCLDSQPILTILLPHPPKPLEYALASIEAFSKNGLALSWVESLAKLRISHIITN